jgi:hypothetical protein
MLMRILSSQNGIERNQVQNSSERDKLFGFVMKIGFIFI